MSPTFYIPVPVDVEPFLQAADTDLKEVKRPPNYFMIFRSEVIHNWPSSLGLRPTDITKSSRIIIPAWNALRDSEEGKAWKLFSQRVAEAHKVRFPQYKYKPGARKEAKPTRKAKKQAKQKVHAVSGSNERNSLSSRATIPNDISTWTQGQYISSSQPQMPSHVPDVLHAPLTAANLGNGAFGGGGIVGHSSQPWQQSEESAKSVGLYEGNGYLSEDFAEAHPSLANNFSAAAHEIVGTWLNSEATSTKLDDRLDLVNHGDDLDQNYTDEFWGASAYVYHGTLPSSPTAYTPRLYLPDALEDSTLFAHEQYMNIQHLELPPLNLEPPNFQTDEY
ncbi:hypothetical protein HYPSUDRAFT_832844 [Hypholoma sublateritium FD-334 SS-4]|uniref:HMG box domain-containing protein n=1 Tax=Hypholoma sublateritium (strain FD-334 SS-4) TaxID=945553 RepID=A0A0D2NM88_HYPSF|nr:hypothetical protein HYPSUDRAFT_832844 [Hypholoma sublateritium FD-334 SS-4]